MQKAKKLVLIFNCVLLGWFFLDMIGVDFGKSILVTKSYKEDGIFFIIFLIAILWFVKNDKIGKYILSLWLSMWFLAQFFSHWYFTIFGPHAGKIQYFKGTVRLIPSDVIYIPDLYHIVLHLLILVALFFTIRYSFCKKHNA